MNELTCRRERNSFECAVTHDALENKQSKGHDFQLWTYSKGVCQCYTARLLIEEQIGQVDTVE